ncbi:ECF-type sigma factor [Rubripirellula lacrimiformis]|uniref:ECF-type sigma factor n=1 Tax=Rubripirellula lacrimiformis TaxID=1930273 RepID=UPI001C54E608|nr:ECF-type sigma factor [Rubripirellula lacrimiformis]
MTDTTVADAFANDPNLDDLAFSDWHAKLRKGDPEFTSQLWDLYFQRMVRLARQRLVGASTAGRDEEDVALSAFKSFCLGVRSGRISIDPDDVNLWPLLVTITLNKAVDQIRYENRIKRNPPGSPAGGGTQPAIEQLRSCEPSPANLAAASETFDSLLDCLRQTQDDDLQIIAIRSIEGNSAGEIAELLGCSPRTVQRKLKTIQAIWEARFHRD